jgi:hypothetical protein
MTQPDPDVLTQALSSAQQAINDFDFAPGLRVSARLERNPDYLALTAESDGHHAFEYRASGVDLNTHPDPAWFIRRALRSLNDRFQAGHLPQTQDQADHEFLRPPDQYEAGD